MSDHDGHRGELSRALSTAVLGGFPRGLMLCASSGVVLWSNEKAQQLLGSAVTVRGTRCCDVLGCLRADTPLGGRCASWMAADRGRPLPETRFDPPGDESVPSIWTLSAPVSVGDANSQDGQTDLVVHQLWSGKPGDRRRATEPHWVAGTRLSICTLGRTELETEEGKLAGKWLGHRPGAVFKYLVCNRRRLVPAEELIEVFWPHLGRQGLRSLRQAIHTLRNVVEPNRERGGSSSFVSARSHGYQLDTRFIWLDIDEFEQRARKGFDLLRQGREEDAETMLADAASIYEGDFMIDEPYAEWTLEERGRLRDLAVAVLRAQTDLAAASDDPESAISPMTRLAEIEPLDIEIQRLLIRLLIRHGHMAQAHRREELVGHRFRVAFGERPALPLDDPIR